jgi:cell division protein FtsZ
MQGAGSALMGIGSARGEDRAVQAAELAISSPLLEASIDGAHGVLLSIQGGSDLGLFEINEAARLVQEAAHPEANIIFGAVIDDALGDEVRVTVIAAGFDGGTPNRRPDERALGTIQGSPQQARPAQAAPQQAAPQTAPQPGGQQPGGQQAPQAAAPAGGQQGAQAAPQDGQDAPLGDAVQGGPAQPAPAEQARPQAQQPPRQVTFDEGDDLDIPDFLK